MRMRVLHSTMFVAVYLIVMSLLTGHRAFAAGTPSCGCHAGKTTKNFIHGPVGSGDCLACHKPTGKKHPQVKKGSFTLSGNGKSGLCYECHEHKDTMKFVHGPVGSGDCLLCHDAHQSDNKAQLKAPDGQLCYLCHEKGKFDRKFSHPPVANGKCTGCHDPHQSNVKYMLKGEGMNLCLLCHEKGMFKGTSVHKPVAQGDCTACHSVHGSQFPHILNHNYSDELYMPFNKDNFSLCFACHNNQIADEQLTDSQTTLRNGMTNIHYIHINKQEKGRSCKTCHNPHAAPQPRLISEKIPGFGNWRIPIRFTKTNTGGTCVVGCHKPKSYDRITPVVNP